MLLALGTTAWAQSKVYLTREISPASLVRIYQALGVKAKGRVAVKISTGEGSNPNYLKPELIKDLVYDVDGTIVENNTAYSSNAMGGVVNIVTRLSVRRAVSSNSATTSVATGSWTAT